MSEISNVKFHSNALKKLMAFSIYLPDTGNCSEKLPALYFFHGRNGDEHFIEQLDVRGIADNLIKEGVINPMIIVCPRMDNTRGLNTSDCSAKIFNDEMAIDVGRYEDYFIYEIIPYVEAHYPVLPDRSSRFVGGASAGGYASVHYGLKYPDLFSRIGGHMPAIEKQLELADLPYYGTEEDFILNDPLRFKPFTNLHKEQSWYLDAGDCDEGGFNESVCILSELLNSRRICCESHIFKGHHNIEYIDSNLEKYLIFYGKASENLSDAPVPIPRAD
ncbi:esterase family protein [Muribaculaceae bacterium Isolate-013 (NCI)]|nr:esterase family protein [Muribaculaceae bacterium Isolate-013 (NCI)]